MLSQGPRGAGEYTLIFKAGRMHREYPVTYQACGNQRAAGFAVSCPI